MPLAQLYQVARLADLLESLRPEALRAVWWDGAWKGGVLAALVLIALHCLFSPGRKE